MKKIIKNQDGFGVIEILLVVVVLGLTGFIGYHAYSQRHKTVTPSQTTQTTTSTTPKKTETPTTTPSADPNAGYIVVKEWGVKMPIDGSVGSLSYTVSGKVASIRSSELDKVSGTCKSNSINVARGKASEVVPNEIGSDDGSTFLQTYNDTTVDSSNLTTRSIKAKVGDYYFVVPGYAGASCSSEANQQAETTAMLNIVKAINKVIAE